MRIYPRENTAVIELAALKDDAGSLVTTATVEATLSLENGDDVPGVTNPIAMSHKGSGKYEGVVPPVGLEDGSRIVVRVRSEVSGVVGTIRETLVVKNRTLSGGYWVSR